MSYRQKLSYLVMLAATLLAGGLPFARAQIPGLPFNGSTDAAPAVLNWASAPVEVNGTVLFRRYARDAETARLRADVASLRLTDIARDASDGPAPEVRVNPDGEPPVDIVVGESIVLTITDADTQATGIEPQRLAETWANEIRRALAVAQEERRPDFLRRAAIAAIAWLLFGLALHLALGWLRRRWLTESGWPAVGLIWSFILGRILTLLPDTRPIYNTLVHGSLRPLTILVFVLLAAVALARIWSSLLRHAFPTDPEDLTLEERTERAYRRRTTLAGVARITGVALIWLIALFAALTWAGVNLPALIASAGLLGVALGLAAQDSMKDIVSGINILLDDRFGVGDVIEVNGLSGTVERLNLRITQIRTISGDLVTFPNREVVIVANKTSRWAQVDMKVGVAYATDLPHAMEVLVQAAMQLYSDWPDRVLAEPNMLGVDAFEGSSIVLRMLLRTTPGDQWLVGRELRLRIKQAFDREGIEIPFSQHDVWIRTEGSQIEN